MLTKIKQYNIKYFWHFTDRSNLLSIKKAGGILSIAEIARKGLHVPAPGGNEWSHNADRRKNLDDYVHLAFINNHPMLYKAKEDSRIKDPVWLLIKTSIAFTPGTLFTSDVSNKVGVTPMSEQEAATEIDFEVLFTRTDWKDPLIKVRRLAAVKSEILIPKVVPFGEIIAMRNG